MPAWGRHCKKILKWSRELCGRPAVAHYWRTPTDYSTIRLGGNHGNAETPNSTHIFGRIQTWCGQSRCGRGLHIQSSCRGCRDLFTQPAQVGDLWRPVYTFVFNKFGYSIVFISADVTIQWDWVLWNIKSQLNFFDWTTHLFGWRTYQSIYVSFTLPTIKWVME